MFECLVQELLAVNMGTGYQLADVVLLAHRIGTVEAATPEHGVVYQGRVVQDPGNGN